MIFKLERKDEKCYLIMGEMRMLISKETKTVDECIYTLAKNFVLSDKINKPLKEYEFVINKMAKHDDFLSLFSDLYERKNPLFDCQVLQESYYNKTIYIYFNRRGIDTELFVTHLNVKTFLRRGSYEPKDIVVAVVAEKLAKSLIDDKAAQKQIVKFLKNNEEWKRLFTIRNLETFM